MLKLNNNLTAFIIIKKLLLYIIKKNEPQLHKVN